jgi:hypothetical protein
VFDTVDLHYLREQRLAELENSAALMGTALKTREQELAVIRACDVTLVVSPVELGVLGQELPGADVRILSNIHELAPPPGLCRARRPAVHRRLPPPAQHRRGRVVPVRGLAAGA